MEWNNSRLSKLQRCAESYRRSEVEGEPEPTSPAAIRGSAVHHVAKVALRRKLRAENQNAALPSIEEAKALAADDFEERWKAADLRIMDAEEDGADVLAKARGESKDTAVALAGYHVGSVAPGMTVVAVERKITVKPRNSDLVIHGTLDLVVEALSTPPWPLGHEPAEDIHDLKTGTKSPQRDAAHRSQQLSMYALIRLAETGKAVDGLVLDHVYRTPGLGLLKHVEQRTTRDQGDFDALVNRINVATEAVTRGTFLPADPTSWFCSQKWCGYWPTCPYVRRGKRPTN